MLLTVAKLSLISRKKTAILTFLSLTISMLVLFSVEHIRLEAKNSFNRSISGTDLIVGAPSGPLNLLLYSVFRLGSPTNNIKYTSYELLAENQLVDWAIPISLGDSHKGFRVVGTNQSYFKHFRYGSDRSLTIQTGKPFNGLFETVIGADVAEALGYKVDDKIIIAHGIGATSFKNHDQAPFRIAGILTRTGTPVDKTVHVSLEAIEAIHLPVSQLLQLVDSPDAIALEPATITAVLLGLNSRLATFRLQRVINNYPQDRLMAVLPGVAMTELWSLVGTVENILRFIAILVLISALFGLSTMLLASMNERRSEIAVLRILGAGPKAIVMLILLEALLLAILSIISAITILTLALFSLNEFLAAEYGLFLTWNIFTLELLYVSLGVIAATSITAALPCYEAYKSAILQQLSNIR